MKVEFRRRLAHTDPAHETSFDVPVKLPSGRTYRPAIPLGDGHDRGFGWEIIKRTPGIDEKDDIGEALNEGEIEDMCGSC